MYFLPGFFIPRVSPGVIIIEPLRGSLYLQTRICICFRAFGFSDFKTSAFRFPPRVAPGDTMIQPLRGWANSPTSICIFFRTRISGSQKLRYHGLKFQGFQNSIAADFRTISPSSTPTAHSKYSPSSYRNLSQ